MDLSQEYEFRNGDAWLKYSHERYLPLEEIRHRLKLRGEKWETVRNNFQSVRKSQAIIFPLKSLGKAFWYFEADCIRKKVSEVEKLGIQLYDKIHSSRTFEAEFIMNAAVEEAITSAIYEGANSTRAKARQLISEGRAPISKDDYMISNNYLAMRWIKKTSASAISLDTILQLHAIVTKNTLTGNDVHYSGKFRDDHVAIGPHEGVDHRLIVPALQEALEQTSKNRRFIHPLIRGILLHYFVAYIHPFFDGNGRTARGLFYYEEIRHDLRFVELLSISAHLKEHGRRYEKSYENAVEHDLDMTYFVDFALDSLLQALKKVDQKVKFLLQIQLLKPRLGLNDQNIALLQRMSLHKFRRLTIEDYAKEISRTHEMARLELKSLTEHGLLLEKKMGKKLTYLVNSDLLKKTVTELANQTLTDP